MSQTLSDLELDAQPPEVVAALVDADADAARDWAHKRIGDGRVHVRRHAALVLATLAELVPECLVTLNIARKDADTEVRRTAITVFASGKVSKTLALGPLVQALADDEDRVADAAAAGLTAVLRKGKADHYKATIALLDNAPVVTTMRVTDIFLGLGSAAIVTLTATLAHPNGYLRRWARDALRTIGKPAANTLIQALSRPHLRAPAAHVLGALNDFDESHVAAIAKLGGSKDEAVQTAAFGVLTAIRKVMEREKQRPADVPHPEFYVRGLSSADLEGATEGVTAEALLWNLRDGRWFVRANSITLMASVGAPDPAIAERARLAFKPLLRDDSRDVRRAVVDATASLFGPAGAELLAMAAASDADPEIAQAAQASLNALAPTATGEIAGLLESADDVTRPPLTQALVTAGNAAVAPVRTLIGAGRAPHARAAAIDTLTRLGAQTPSDRTLLLARLGDEDGAVRAAAADALATLFSKDANVTTSLRETARHESIPEVRRTAALAADRSAGKVPSPAVKAPTPLPLPGFDVERLPAANLAKYAAKLNIEKLRPLFTDGRANVRHNVALSLALSPKALTESDWAWLVLSLRDGDTGVRGAAAQTIAQHPRAPGETLPALAEGLVSPPSAWLEAQLVRALIAYGNDGLSAMLGAVSQRAHLTWDDMGRLGEQIPPVLVLDLSGHLLDPHPPTTRALTADLLAIMGPNAVDATGDLITTMSAPSSRLRVRVVRAFGRVAEPTVAHYEKLLLTGNSDARASVKQAVERAIDTLVGRLDEAHLDAIGGVEAQKNTWLRELTAPKARVKRPRPRA